MKKRVKVGDVEIGAMRNPAPEKTNFIVYRFRPRSHEYLSKEEVSSKDQAEYLFTQLIGQEHSLQAQLAAAAGEIAEDGFTTEAPACTDHPLFARF